MDIISYEDFRALVARHARTLLAVASHYVQFRCDGRPPTRPLLGELMSHSTQLEELIDAYGARDNRRWSPFRSLVAAIKLFSDVSYELLHIRHSVKLYQLLPIGQDVAAATDRTLAFTTEVLHKAALKILRLADELGFDPLSASSSGLLIALVRPEWVREAVWYLNILGIPASVIGAVSERRERWILGPEGRRPFPEEAEDPYASLMRAG